MTYSDLKASLEVFGFNERDQLTFAQIKRRHRELVKASHPDVSSEAAVLNMQRINSAASMIFSYLNSYHFTFSEEDFYRQNPDERLRMQFANVPGWGG